MKTYDDLPLAMRGLVDQVVLALYEGGRTTADEKFRELVAARGLTRAESSALAMYSLMRGQSLGYLSLNKGET